MSTCRRLIKQVEAVAQSQSNKQLKNITLSIGELARVDIDELIELFPIASRGTCAENAQLIIRREAISIKCIQCNKVSDVSMANMNCPVCNSEDTQLLGGDDMTLQALEYV